MAELGSVDSQLRFVYLVLQHVTCILFSHQLFHAGRSESLIAIGRIFKTLLRLFDLDFIRAVSDFRGLNGSFLIFFCMSRGRNDT